MQQPESKIHRAYYKELKVMYKVSILKIYERQWIPTLNPFTPINSSMQNTTPAKCLCCIVFPLHPLLPSMFC